MVVERARERREGVVKVFVLWAGRGEVWSMWRVRLWGKGWRRLRERERGGGICGPPPSLLFPSLLSSLLLLRSVCVCVCV